MVETEDTTQPERCASVAAPSRDASLPRTTTPNLWTHSGSTTRSIPAIFPSETVNLQTARGRPRGSHRPHYAVHQLRTTSAVGERLSTALTAQAPGTSAARTLASARGGFVK